MRQLGFLAMLAAGALGAGTPGGIAIDYPEEGSIFPPEMAPPTFVWHDTGAGVTRWRIRISFADGTAPLHASSAGPRMQIGEIDPDCVADTNQPPRLTAKQAAAHTRLPEAALWESVKKHATATVTIAGWRGTELISRGRVTIHTSQDAAGAPIFYRDVPPTAIPFPGTAGRWAWTWTGCRTTGACTP